MGKVNREGGYVWMKKDEVIALLDLLKNGGTREVQRSGGRQQRITLPPQPHTWALIFFLVHTGARLSEAQALCWSDVDMEARTIQLNGGVVGKMVQRIKARTIPMCDAVHSLFSFLAPGEPEKLIFGFDEKLHRTMKLAYECAGLPRYKLTALRDTTGSQLAMIGIDLHMIAKYLGFNSLKHVEKYAHLQPPVDLVAVMQRLNFTGSHCGEGAPDHSR